VGKSSCSASTTLHCLFIPSLRLFFRPTHWHLTDREPDLMNQSASEKLANPVHAANASRIWPVFQLAVLNRQTLTYNTLGQLVGIHPRAIGRELEPIHTYCLAHRLPPTALAVDSSTGRPGSGFKASTDLPRAFAQVYAHRWGADGRGRPHGSNFRSRTSRPQVGGSPPPPCSAATSSPMRALCCRSCSAGRSCGSVRHDGVWFLHRTLHTRHLGAAQN
jgi:hypothetical protein